MQTEFDKMIDTYMSMLLNYKQGEITKEHCIEMCKFFTKFLEENK